MLYLICYLRNHVAVSKTGFVAEFTLMPGSDLRPYLPINQNVADKDLGHPSKYRRA